MGEIPFDQEQVDGNSVNWSLRTRHLIELGGLVVKAGIVDLTGTDRATTLGALIWIAEKLKGEQSKQARALRV
ncbi:MULTISPECIES: conjugal transfer protein TraD [unclassified Bradyrhizobium]|uniref:conjugal transfer protein TraD n=1 Tax=unclassified Bradyrhizobium TaxID=2631580 RepID=UPI0029163DD8|nr:MULTISPECIES: conjugal transfer protein TraD [unclassified Bradyrhizobium]